MTALSCLRSHHRRVKSDFAAGMLYRRAETVNSARTRRTCARVASYTP